jgi:hypothetical protein
VQRPQDAAGDQPAQDDRHHGHNADGDRQQDQDVLRLGHMHLIRQRVDLVLELLDTSLGLG